MADATARVLFDLLPDYERWQRRRHLAPGTIKRRRQLLTRFNRWCQGEGLSIVEVVTEDIERWLDHLGQGAKGISPQTRHNYTRVLSSFYGWAVRAEVVERDPTLEVVRPRLPRALPRPMDPADLVRAMDASDDRKAAMLALTAFAGLRCKEIAGLQIEDVDFKHKRILVAHGKGNKERVVPLHPEVERRLRRVAPEHGYVFHRTWPYVTPEPIKPETVSSFVSHVYRDMGIKASAHRGRHLFLTAVYEECQDIRVVQELAGHASPQTTARYAAWSQKRAEDAVAALSFREDR